MRAVGHEVFVVLGTEGETLQRMRAAGLRCEFVPMALTDKWHWWRYAEARRKLVRLFRREQPDVVHCNDLPTSQMVGQSAERLGIPRVCHHRFPFDRLTVDWLNKFGAERHVFVSRYLMDDVCGVSPQVAAAPCAIVHDGLPLPSIPTDTERKAARTQLNLPLNKVLVLFAGQLIERKGVADLIQAWHAISSAASRHAELLIVGDDLQNGGRYRIDMERLARQLGSPARFFGFQRNLPDWLAAADVAVVPSHVEPLGNATLEAMAYALPVVGCDVGGIPEMIVDEETGVLVPPKNPEELAAAIQRLIENAELRKRMGTAGRRRCERHFSIENHTANMLEQYQSTLRSCSGSLIS